jgi:hypothetical protein
VLHTHWKSSCRRINRPASEEFRNNFYSGPFTPLRKLPRCPLSQTMITATAAIDKRYPGRTSFLVRGVLQWMNHTTQIRTLATVATLRPNRNPFNTRNVIRM